MDESGRLREGAEKLWVKIEDGEKGERPGRIFRGKEKEGDSMNLDEGKRKGEMNERRRKKGNMT